MRVLLDECRPRRLGSALVGHDVNTVPQMGLAGFTNGELLKRVDGAIDAFITVDKNLPAQNMMASLSFGVIILRAESNRLNALTPLVPQILAELAVPAYNSCRNRHCPNCQGAAQIQWIERRQDDRESVHDRIDQESREGLELG